MAEPQRRNMAEHPAVVGVVCSDEEEPCVTRDTSRHDRPGARNLGQAARQNSTWIALSVGLILGMLVGSAVVLAHKQGKQQAISASGGAAARPSRGGPPRNVYLDLGANWADTLDLFRRIADSEHSGLANWEVYAFEISPHLIPYVDRFVRYKNGFDKRPAACVFPISASGDKKYFASALGCQSPDQREADACMQKKMGSAPRDFLHNAHPNMVALSAVARQLDVAAYPLEHGATAPRYTFVPAGVGPSSGTIVFGDDKSRTDTAGLPKSSLGHIAGLLGKRQEESVTVQVIDFASWIEEHFSREDYIVLKIDIEGAEFPLFDKLQRKSLMGFFDVVALECHHWSGDCKQLDTMVRGSVERLVYEGRDYRSRANMTRAVEQFRRDWLSHECDPFRP